MKTSVSFIGLIWLVLFSWIGADEINFNQQIRPILAERCFACHGALKQESSLRLDSATMLHQGGDSGDVLDLETPNDSELLLRVTDEDESVRMPPEGKMLSASEVDLIRNWIEQGAKIPANDVAEIPPEKHWAFIRPVKTRLSSEEATKIGPADSSNVVDALLQRQRSTAGITTTAGKASKRLLLRRVYLDLIGVPPTLVEQQAFLNDSSDDAFEKVVDRLLASPHYGERWGRHWMDIWRYTDWYGLGAQLRNSQKHLRHWRDWIIESLNDDKGYDQFILEMLAADELYPRDRDRIRGTGFLARNYYLFNRTTWLDSTLEHTSKAFLGLTMNCAKCHDHKYDPLSQLDYYRMRAIFEPHQVRLDPLPGVVDLEKDGLPRVFDAHPDAKTYVHRRGNEKDPDLSFEVKADSPGFFKFGNLQPALIELPPEAANPALQEFVLQDRVAATTREIKALEQQLAATRLAVTQAAKQPSSQQPQEKRTPYDQVKLAAPSLNLSFIRDSFDRLDAKTWLVKSGRWKTDQGRLVQSESGATRKVVETRHDHPTDFLLEAVLSVSAGEMWKSFGVSFDASTHHEKTVYLSAYKDSKIQISYSNHGKSVYPSNALIQLPVDLNRDYRLRIAVRGNLINVSLDGKHLLTYDFPGSRQAGKLQLMSFDSVASFDSLHVARLSRDVQLYSAGPSAAESLEQAELKVEFLKAKLAAAQLKIKKLESSYHADLAKAKQQKDVAARVQGAALAARQYEVAAATVAVKEWQMKRAAASPAEQAQLNKSLKAAQKSLQAAQQSLEHPGEKYEAIRASRKALEGPDEKPESRNRPFPTTSTGRRTAFAKWIIHPNNPLTARVAVNQIWMRHFGQPLVEPVTDFGRRTQAPLHQELLDWLAVDLMENGWKMKRLHKLIILSNAYQMSPQPASTQTSAEHPQAQTNELYTFRSPIRMESQVVRDSLLQLAGTLEERLGGPPIDPKSDTKRRSLYFRQSRDHQNKFVGMFDDADILRCYRRQESIIPQQALTLANSRLAYQSAQRITANLSQELAGQENPEDNQFVKLAFLTILGREPSKAESTTVLQALAELKQLSSGQPNSLSRSRTNIVMALINSNDFVTIR